MYKYGVISLFLTGCVIDAGDLSTITDAIDKNDTGSSSIIDNDNDGVAADEDCDDSNPEYGNQNLDQDCDSLINTEDCDDNDATSTSIAEDSDCDGILTDDDCDDTDENATTVATDADCDGTITADDCDDNDQNSTVIADDGDCDGIITAEDCDDNDSTLTASSEDADCDGVITIMDCNDNDNASTILAEDADCDGTITAEDCDDNDQNSTVIADDGDCDTILTADDCNDNDALSTTLFSDADCDTVLLDYDCDDNDSTSTILAEDADCDGVLTADDCNDNDNASTTIATDGDCDGTITAEDCNDNDDASTTIVTDADCDGTITAEDCDDNDDTSTILAEDADCDGVLTSDDCDDNDDTSTILAEDADCDGTITADDCNDNDNASTTIVTDADCDGIITAEDCDDNNDSSTTVSTDTDCDGIINDNDQDNDNDGQCDNGGGSIANDADCDGINTADDCDDNDPESTIIALDTDCDGFLLGEDCDNTDPESYTTNEDADCDGVITIVDCDDNDNSSTTIPVDYDCDGILNEDDLDATNDGQCDNGNGPTQTNADCDETLASEDCDDNDPTSTILAVDADCDGVLTPEDCDDNDNSSTTIATDADCDGTITAEDCDDSDNTSTTIADDADCDGTITAEDCNDNDDASTILAEDADCDGTLTADDCDDNEFSINPSVEEIWYDGVDQNCDGLNDFDQDGDGHVAESYTNGGGDFVYHGGPDCDDNNTTVYQGATELCDAEDNDCDDLIDEGVSFTFYYDEDGDGFGLASDSVTECSNSTNEEGYVAEHEDGFDCDDSDELVNPHASDDTCDDVDNNCNNIIDEGGAFPYYQDSDGDGFGDKFADVEYYCSAPVGVSGNNEDCDDDNIAINPSVSETCNHIDDNCNEHIDEGLAYAGYYFYDADEDGYGVDNPDTNYGYCDSDDIPQGDYSLEPGDCDDNDYFINPGVDDIPNNGIDEDCIDGDEVTVDSDGDGVADSEDCAPTDDEFYYTDVVCDGIVNECGSLVETEIPIEANESLTSVIFENSVYTRYCFLGSEYQLDNTIELNVSSARGRIELIGASEDDRTVLSGNENVRHLDSDVAHDATLYINNINFFDGSCTAAGCQGGAIKHQHGVLEIESAEFSNNYSYEGGAIFTSEGSLIMNNITFKHNVSIEDGGALRTSITNTSLDNVRFADNNSCNKTLSFQACSDGGRGGAVYVHAGGLHEWNSVSFLNNEAYMSGGGLTALTNNGFKPDFEFNNVLFSNNTSQNGSGGAIYISGGSLDAQNFIVHMNGAAGSGGGIFMDSASFLHLRYSSLVANASNNGGAVHVHSWGSNPTLEIKGSDFSHNEAEQNRDIKLPNSGLSTSNITIGNNNVFEGESGSLLEDYSTTSHEDPDYLDFQNSPPNLRLSTNSALYNSAEGSAGSDVDPDDSEADIGAYGGPGADLWDLDGDGYFQCWDPLGCISSNDDDDFNPDQN